MSKIICEVCGTSYPETSSQCPICGSVHHGDVLSTSTSVEETEHSGEYTYVKGGRFSKSNVRKRNKGVKVATTAAPKKKSPQTKDTKDEETTNGKKKSKENTGLVITIFVLILAIVAVLAYIVVKFLLPPSSGNKQPNSPENQNPVVENVDVNCTDVTLDIYTLTLNSAGQTANLHVDVLPADTTDKIRFSSGDETVATVDQNGVITAVGRGETAITVSCGNITKECIVICDIIPPEALEFRLNRQQITFDSKGAGWRVYNGDIPVEDIIWTSDDESVAVIEAGRITAVGEGYTTVYGEYLGNKQSCEVMCAFESEADSGHEGTGGVTEDEGESQAPSDSTEYHLDNLYSSFDTEVSIGVGESFPLRLVDENGNQVEATWYVTEEGVCKVDGGDVTALASGETYIVAVYNGQEYRCLVRVY